MKCCDCGEIVFRRRHPTMGVPVRCADCEVVEADRLREIASRGRRSLGLEDLLGFERLKDSPGGERRRD